MFKTRKFQSWARVGATYLPPCLPLYLSCSLSVSLFASSPFPSVSLFAVCLLFVATSELDQLSKIVCTPQCTLCLAPSSLSPFLFHTLALISGCPRNSFAAQSACLPAKLICFATNCCTNKHNAISINFMAHLFAKHLSQHLPASPACPTTTCRHPLGHPLTSCPTPPSIDTTQPVNYLQVH